MPRVRAANDGRTLKSKTNVPSTTSKNAGLSEDPDSKIVPKKELS